MGNLRNEGSENGGFGFCRDWVLPFTVVYDIRFVLSGLIFIVSFT